MPTRMHRLVRIALASVILATALLMAPLSAASAATQLQATIKSVGGASMGTATFTPGSYGGVKVQITLSGYNPVGGDRRLSIRNSAGAEVLVLPNIQFFPNGSANYETVISNITLDWLERVAGATLIIQADTYAASEVIGWGSISPYAVPWPTPWQPWQPGCPGGYCPQPQPQPQPQPWPQPWPHPQPPPPPPTPAPPIVGTVTVTAGLGLNLRSGPGLGYAIRRIVTVGTRLESTGITQWANGYKWLKVRYGGAYYWAASAWLQ